VIGAAIAFSLAPLAYVWLTEPIKTKPTKFDKRSAVTMEDLRYEVFDQIAEISLGRLPVKALFLHHGATRQWNGLSTNRRIFESHCWTEPGGRRSVPSRSPSIFSDRRSRPSRLRTTPAKKPRTARPVGSSTRVYRIVRGGGARSKSHRSRHHPV
jgi:hypothetical protein